jgi:anti-sigma regulatory factor (Ser/Thr protein kinase)
VSVDPLWLHEVTLVAEPESVGTARHFVREHLSGHDLLLLVDDITLVASELTTNAVTHAGTPFTVKITAFADAVVLTVSDGSASLPRRLDALTDDDAGRGVAIIDVVSRDWGVVVDATAGKSVWAAFDVV